MERPDFVSLLPLATERAGLDAAFDELNGGDLARPVMVGRERVPEAVLISLAMFRQVAGEVGELVSVSLSRSSAERARLDDALDQLNSRTSAHPVMIGRGIEPEAVMITFSMFHRLADDLDEMLSAPEITDRLALTAAGGGPHVAALEELAATAGVDVSALPDAGPWSS